MTSGFSYKKWDSIVDSDDEVDVKQKPAKVKSGKGSKVWDELLPKLDPAMSESMKKIKYPSKSLLANIQASWIKMNEWVLDESLKPKPSLLLCYYWRQDVIMNELKCKLHPNDTLFVGSGDFQALVNESVSEDSFVQIKDCPSRPIPTIEHLSRPNHEFWATELA